MIGNKLLNFTQPNDFMKVPFNSPICLRSDTNDDFMNQLNISHRTPVANINHELELPMPLDRNDGVNCHDDSLGFLDFKKSQDCNSYSKLQLNLYDNNHYKLTNQDYHYKTVSSANYSNETFSTINPANISTSTIIQQSNSNNANIEMKSSSPVQLISPFKSLKENYYDIDKIFTHSDIDILAGQKIQSASQPQNNQNVSSQNQIQNSQSSLTRLPNFANLDENLQIKIPITPLKNITSLNNYILDQSIKSSPNYSNHSLNPIKKLELKSNRECHLNQSQQNAAGVFPQLSQSISTIGFSSPFKDSSDSSNKLSKLSKLIIESKNDIVKSGKDSSTQQEALQRSKPKSKKITVKAHSTELSASKPSLKNIIKTVKTSAKIPLKNSIFANTKVTTTKSKVVEGSIIKLDRMGPDKAKNEKLQVSNIVHEVPKIVANSNSAPKIKKVINKGKRNSSDPKQKVEKKGVKSSFELKNVTKVAKRPNVGGKNIELIKKSKKVENELQYPQNREINKFSSSQSSTTSSSSQSSTNTSTFTQTRSNKINSSVATSAKEFAIFSDNEEDYAPEYDSSDDDYTPNGRRKHKKAKSNFTSNANSSFSSGTTLKKPKIKNSKVSKTKKRILGPRSKTGCWTCRIRHKACPEQRPTCEQCERLNLLCDYSIERPDYMVDSNKNLLKLKEIKEITVRLKKTNKKNPKGY